MEIGGKLALVRAIIITALGAAFGALICFAFGSIEGMPGVLEGATIFATAALSEQGVGAISDALIRKYWIGQRKKS